jgi:subtilisin-like proprotein convertase family protein
MRKLLAATAAAAVLGAAGSASAAVFVFNGAGGPINDLATISTNVNVAPTFTVQDVNVTIQDLFHTYWSDVDIFLSHGATTVQLHENQGNSSDPNGDFTFDDEAASPHTALNTSGGAFQPLNALSAFDGLSSSGVWTLTIGDDVGNDVGSYAGWTLSLTGESVGAVPEPATWALMILGFGGAGAMVRRRRTVSLTA